MIKNTFYQENIRNITQDVFLMLDAKGSSRAVEGHARKEATALVGKLPGPFTEIILFNCESVKDEHEKIRCKERQERG